MHKVDKSRLRPVDTTDWAERPRLFVDTFGGWESMEYMWWVGREKEKYLNKISKERGYRVVSIPDQDDFTKFLKERVK